jgi:hypothetical protein
MKKIVLLTMVLFMFGGLSLPVQAQSLNFKAGLFLPTMNSDLWEDNLNNLAFRKQDMLAGYYGAEYEQFLGHYLSLSVEGGYYKKEFFSLYKDYTYQNDDPIYQNMSLEITSLEVGFKLYPLGHNEKFYPYIGAGGGMYYWKYEQWGDFVDFEENTIMQDQYLETSTYSPGVNVKAGFVLRPSRGLGISLEGRYQYVKGDLSQFFQGFEKFDLSGFSATVGMNIFL